MDELNTEKMLYHLAADVVCTKDDLRIDGVVGQKMCKHYFGPIYEAKMRIFFVPQPNTIDHPNVVGFIDKEQRFYKVFSMNDDYDWYFVGFSIYDGP